MFGQCPWCESVDTHWAGSHSAPERQAVVDEFVCRSCHKWFQELTKVKQDDEDDDEEATDIVILGFDDGEPPQPYPGAAPFSERRKYGDDF